MTDAYRRGAEGFVEGKEDSVRGLIEEMNGKMEQVANAETLRCILTENRLQCGIQHGHYSAKVSFQR